MVSKRQKRRDRGRVKEQSALRERYPDHLFVKGPVRLSVSVPRELRSTIQFLEYFDECTKDCGKAVLLDLHDTGLIDGTACVMLAAAIQRYRIGHNLQVDVRLPRNGFARFALKIFGVADEADAKTEVSDDIDRQVMKVTSGTKGDPSPGAVTFQVARLAEGLVADETLADRVHAALNEAADNVLSWAYGEATTSADRWWVAGVLMNQSATFIALDHGAGIPATAPQNLGDSLTGMIKTMMQEKGWRQINLKPTDSQILLATIRQRRTVSGLGKR